MMKPKLDPQTLQNMRDSQLIEHFGFDKPFSVKEFFDFFGYPYEKGFYRFDDFYPYYLNWYDNVYSSPLYQAMQEEE